MIPHFATPSHSLIDVPPAYRFKVIVGSVRDVEMRTSIPPRTGEHYSAAQRQGLVYEEKIILELSLLFKQFHRPRFTFRDDSGYRYCVPDGVLSLPDHRVIIIEIKYSHVPEAWWQLRRLYQPVIQKMYPEHQIEVCEICRSYDSNMPFPEKIELIDNPHRLLSPSNQFRVLRWKL